MEEIKKKYEIIKPEYETNLTTFVQIESEYNELNDQIKEKNNEI